MAKKIVEYEINDDGDCGKCKGRKKTTFESLCLPFANEAGCLSGTQNQACKDFLVQEASKVYCSDCVHLGDYPDWGCNKGQDLNNSLNCKNKEAGSFNTKEEAVLARK